MSLLNTLESITGHPLKKIGEGAYSKVYRALDNTALVYILSPSDDYVKEILTHIESPHIPVMRRVDDLTYNYKEYTIWETQYSESPMKKHGRSFEQMRILQREWEKTHPRFFRLDRYNWHAVVANFIDDLRSNDAIEESVIDALDKIYTWSTAYGSNFKFEFPKCNLGVTEDGTLLLRDIVFFR